MDLSELFPGALSKPITIKETISDLKDIQDEAIQHVWINESPLGRNTATYKLALKAKQGSKYAGHQKRVVWTEPFPTIIKPSSDGMGINQYLRNSHCHPIYTRTFSVRELARGQSFPDDFKFTGLEGANRIGNSVPPMLIRAIALQIKHILWGGIS